MQTITWADFMAERVGFEPTVRHNRTPDFESGAIDHSTTSPGAAFSQGRIIAFRTARYAITSGLMTTSKIYSRAVRPHKQGM